MKVTVVDNELGVAWEGDARSVICREEGTEVGVSLASHYTGKKDETGMVVVQCVPQGSPQVISHT